VKGLGERGITLMEVLCVLLIVSIIGTVSFAVGAETLDNYRLDKAAKLLVSDLREAREEAITENVWQEIRFFPYANMYRIVRAGVRVNDVQLETGIELYAPQKVTFYPSGSPAEGVTLTLTNKRGKQLQIVVAAVTGRVRLAP
jgi:prepilin-type N-terminal cleavage/methylation domain-containing protein